MPVAETYLHISEIKKEYRTERDSHLVLDIENLEVTKGEFVCILGPSGCGKSTLLNIIGGFERASSGNILLDGQAIEASNKSCIMVFQDFGLFPWKNVIENVSFGLMLSGTDKKEIKAISEECLNLVGLSLHANSYPHQLSGGMKQRVAIARALAVDPKLLLMDEPFGALDALTRLNMQDELSRICQQAKKTILFVTHSVDEAIYLGDRVVVLSDTPGRIKKIFNVPMERPRRKSDPHMLALKTEILGELGVTI